MTGRGTRETGNGGERYVEEALAMARGEGDPQGGAARTRPVLPQDPDIEEALALVRECLPAALSEEERHASRLP
ncbi:molybdopterin molybdenumtransferase MoeA, partial [Streptomyces griseoaurantiacus]